MRHAGHARRTCCWRRRSKAWTSTRRGDRNFPLALSAAREAVDDSRLDLETCDRTRIATSFGTCGGPTPWMAARIRQPPRLHDCIRLVGEPHLLGRCRSRVADASACRSADVQLDRVRHRRRSPRSTRCRAIRDGQCDVAFVGAAQAIHPILRRRLLQHARAGQGRRPRRGLPAVRRQSQRLRHGRRRGGARARAAQPTPAPAARRSTPRCSAAPW